MKKENTQNSQNRFYKFYLDGKNQRKTNKGKNKSDVFKARSIFTYLADYFLKKKNYSLHFKTKVIKQKMSYGNF